MFVDHFNTRPVSLNGGSGLGHKAGWARHQESPPRAVNCFGLARLDQLETEPTASPCKRGMPCTRADFGKHAYSCSCQGDRIRTCGLLFPKQVRCQAALHPEGGLF